MEHGLYWKYGEYWWAVALGFALLVGLRLGLAFWRSRLSARLADHPLRSMLTRGISPSRRALASVLLIGGMGLLGLAALRPQYGMDEAEFTRKGIDIAIALDMSSSMLTPDVEPNRLTASVLELEELLGLLEGGRVGLVPFAGVAFKQSPLTSDFNAIRLYLRSLNPADLPVPGTAIGKALDESLKVLAARASDADQGSRAKDGEESEIQPYKGSKYKVIFLITDGEDHGTEPLEVARRARDLGIKIYTMGVGSIPGDMVPELDGETGRPTGNQMKDLESGNPVVSHLNEELLEQIASITGGKYFHYTGQPIASAIYQEVDKLEKQEVEVTMDRLRRDRFQFLLIPGLAMLLLGLAIPERRRIADAHGK